jgi:hypothetical protein
MGNRGPALALVGALIISVGCGGADSPESSDPVSAATPIGPDGGTVQSSDGRFTLDVPAGALDDTVDISITKTTAADWSEEVTEAEPLAVYRMEPDGLTFAEPAIGLVVVDIEADDDGVDVPISLIYTDDGFELPAGQSAAIDLDRGEARATLEVAHFSDVVVGNSVMQLDLGQIDPFERAVGERFATFAGISNHGSARLESDEVSIIASGPVNVVAGISNDVNLDPVQHVRIEIPPYGEAILYDPSPEYLCTASSPPFGLYGFEVIARVGGSLVAEIIRRVRRLNPLSQREWHWELSIVAPVRCVGGAGGSVTTSTIAPSLDEADEPDDIATDPCGVGGCIDYGAGLGGSTDGRFDWSSTGCESTPESTEGEFKLEPGPDGARIDLPGLGGSVTVGGGTITVNGSGPGGTITTNGETIRRSREIEVIDVGDDGFSVRAENRRGPVDDNGDMIADRSTCDEGGILDFSTPDWPDILDLPRFDEPPISTGNFECYIVPEGDSGVIHFWLPLDLVPPEPPSPFEIKFDIFGLDEELRADPTTVISNFEFDVRFNGDLPPNALPPPGLGVDGNGVWGTFGLEHLAGVERGGTLDVQPIVTNGVARTYAASDVCPWQG